MRRAFFLLLFTFISIASASDVPLYNFGTMQDGMEYNATAGETLNVSLYFFMDEVYGNQVSHILLSPGNVRSPWEVEFTPAAHSATVDVGDTWVNITENIYVEPKPVLPEIPSPPEEGVEYLESPSGLGYLQAKKVEVSIKVPESIPSGFYHVIISAKAEYFGQAGGWHHDTGKPPKPLGAWWLKFSYDGEAKAIKITPIEA